MKYALSYIFLSLFVSSAAAQSTVNDAIALIERKQSDSAKVVLASILARDENNAGAHLVLGKLLLMSYRDFDASEEHLEKAVEFDDGNAEAHWFLGSVYGAQAQRAGIFSKFSYAKKVKTQFLRAVELKPGEIRFRESLMGFYLLAPGIVGGSVEKAKEQAEEIKRLRSSAGHLAYARIALYEKNQGWAESELLQAIHDDPTLWTAHHRLGYLYLDQKRVDDAITQFERYVALAPEDANSYDSLGEGFLEKNDIDSAIRQFRKALSTNPKFFGSVYNLGRAYEKKGEKTEAIRYFKEYLESDPDGIFASDAETKVKELSR